MAGPRHEAVDSEGSQEKDLVRRIKIQVIWSVLSTWKENPFPGSKNTELKLKSIFYLPTSRIRKHLMVPVAVSSKFNSEIVERERGRERIKTFCRANQMDLVLSLRKYVIKRIKII